MITHDKYHDDKYQAALRPDEVNCKVRETLTLIMYQNMEITRKLLSIFKENTRDNLKSLYYICKIILYYVCNIDT